MTTGSGESACVIRRSSSGKGVGMVAVGVGVLVAVGVNVGVKVGVKVGVIVGVGLPENTTRKMVPPERFR